jgi:hypothetical protein
MIPRIIPQDLFERVQERLVKNKYAPARSKAIDEKYLLTTKLFCGDCGSPMVGESGTSANTKTYRYYKCVNAKKGKGCKRKSVKKEWIEEIVIKYVMQALFDDELMGNIADRLVAVQKQENDTIPLLKKQGSSVFTVV